MVTTVPNMRTARNLVVGVAAVVFVVGAAGCSFSLEESDRKQVDVPVLEALDTLRATGSVELLSSELETPTCAGDCPPPSRSWFYGCNSCRRDVQASVQSMSEELLADGWDVLPEQTSVDVLTFVKRDPASRTGEVHLQILPIHGQGLIRQDPSVVVDGTESQIWVRASPEGFGV